MASCTDVPTLTTVILQTTSTPSTSLTTLTTTLPPTESLVTATECTLSQNSTCAGSTVLTTTTTIPGATQILTNTITTDVPLTLSQTSTLFSQSCTTPPSAPPPIPPSTTSTLTQQTTSTLPNGQTTVIVTVVTSVMQGDTTTVAPGVQNSDTGGGGGGGGSSSGNGHLGAIIGGAVGGVFGLVALALAVWFILKRRKRWDDIFDHDDALGGVGQDRRFSLSADLDSEPKPYQYGLVGLPGSTPGPPGSPPLHSTQYSSESSAYGGMSADPHQQYNRRGSLSPLNLPPGAVASGMQHHTPSTMSVSRPSTASSTQPLTNNGPPIPQQGMYAQQQQQSSYPPGMQQYHQHQRGQSSMTGHSATPSLNSPPLQPLTGWMMNTGVPNNPQHPHTHEEVARSGSPMSYQEPRRLQIANYRDSVASSSPIEEESPRRTSLGTSLGGITPFTTTSETSQRDGKGRLKTSGSASVVVHTDGGRVQQSTSQPATSAAASAGPAPPAYSEQ